MSEANEILRASIREIKEVIAQERASRRMLKSMKPSLRASGDDEVLYVLRKTHARHVGQVLGYLFGFTVALPFYVLNRMMEIFGVMPGVAVLGMPVGVLIWYALGDRASVTEFVAFTVGTGMVCIPIAFLCAYSAHDRDDE
jgi:hypothetical protein